MAEESLLLRYRESGDVDLYLMLLSFSMNIFIDRHSEAEVM